MAVETGKNWADLDDDEATTPEHPSVVEQADGTRLITEFRTTQDGKRVKVVRRIRLTLQKTALNHAVAERKKLAKFGSSRGLPPGPDSNSTTLGDVVTLKLAKKSFLAPEASGPVVTEEEERKIKLMSMKSSILCRICKGNHYSMNCPYKDTHVPLDQIAAGGAAATKEATEAEEAKANPTGKYVPPSQRPGARAAGTGETMDGRGGRGDDACTLRISNLSQEVVDSDIYELASNFGRVQRVYVSRHRETGECRGFAFVTFYELSAAEKACRVLDGFGYDNLILRAEFAQPSAPKP